MQNGGEKTILMAIYQSYADQCFYLLLSRSHMDSWGLHGVWVGEISGFLVGSTDGILQSGLSASVTGQ